MSAINRSWSAAWGRFVQPGEALDWLPAIVLLAAALEASRCIAWFRPWTYHLLGVLLAGGAATRLLWGARDYLPSRELRDAGFVPDAWTGLEAVAGIGAISLLWGSVIVAWARQPESETPVLGTVLAALVAVAGALLTAESGSLVYAAHFGLLASLLVSCGCAAWAWGMYAGPSIVASWWTLLFGSLVLMSSVYAGLHGWSAALLVVAWTVASAKLPRAAGRTMRRAALWRSGVCALALGAAGGRIVIIRMDEGALPAAPFPTENPYQLLK